MTCLVCSHHILWCESVFLYKTCLPFIQAVAHISTQSCAEVKVTAPFSVRKAEQASLVSLLWGSNKSAELADGQFQPSGRLHSWQSSTVTHVCGALEGRKLLAYLLRSSWRRHSTPVRALSHELQVDRERKTHKSEHKSSISVKSDYLLYLSCVVLSFVESHTV